MERDNRAHINLEDLQKCMKRIINMYKGRTGGLRNSTVSIVHPSYSKTMVSFEYDGKTKNIKLLSDVTIVLKY